MEIDLKSLIENGCKKAEDCIISGNYKEAEIISSQILKVNTNCYHAKLILGYSTAKSGNLQDGIELLKKCIQENENDFRGYNNLGLITEDPYEAMNYYEKASHLTNEIFPRMNYALELAKIGEDEKAEDILRKFSSQNITAKFNYAGFMHERCRYKEAEIVYREIIKEDPNYHIAKFNLGAICLLNGELKEGYDLLESRWDIYGHLIELKKQIKLPKWDGSPGKTVILFCEQGIGDYIQFLRYAYKVQETCKVILQIGESLKDAIVGFDFFTGQNADCCISVCSLPPLFDFEIPKPINLIAKNIDFSLYNGNLNGLCWCGSTKHSDDNKRSIELKKFDNICRTKNTKWFSCGWATGKWEKEANLPIIDTGSYQKDIHSVAGIVKNMQSIITVDTACAHIAGSLGKKTYLLLSKHHDWRWGKKDKTEWYDSIEIIRQEKRSDWSNPLIEVHSRVLADIN